MIYDLVKKNRTYRRFFQQEPVTQETLTELIELARLSSCGANMQSLKYILSWEPARNELIFPHLRWAGYLKEWHGPEEGEKPAAYVIMLGDKEISSNHFWDHGIASQSILLGAVEKGLGGCMFGSIDRQGLTRALAIPERYEILMVIALGKPKETVVIEEMADPANVKYWRDGQGVHHVPKRRLEELIVTLD
ncbi:MAG: nitroreductase [Paenibacillaceae bacterium]|nr:nitroreductase [Paenibacillaceae bacterium]